jgi:hypothetical protein
VKGYFFHCLFELQFILTPLVTIINAIPNCVALRVTRLKTEPCRMLASDMCRKIFEVGVLGSSSFVMRWSVAIASLCMVLLLTSSSSVLAEKQVRAKHLMHHSMENIILPHISCLV